VARNEVKVTITGDADKFKRSLGEAETGLARFSSKMAAFGDSMRSAGMQMTAAVTLPIVGAGLVAINYAGQLEDASAMSKQVFGSMSKDVQKWSQTSAESFGLSRKDAVEWANQFGIRLTNISGMAQEQAARTSMALTGLAGDLASAFGGPVTDAAQALSSALTGEFEPLKRYGIVINETALKTEYLAQTGQKLTGTLSPQQKQLLTLSLLMKGAKTVTGDYARNAEGATNKIKTMRAKFEDLATTLGEKILPIAVKVADWLTKLADKFEKLSPTAQKFILIGLAIAAAIGPVVYIIGAFSTAISFLATALGFLFSPIGLVVAALVAIGAALVFLYKNNEGFRTWVNNVASSIRDGLGKAVQWFKDTVWPKLVEAFNTFKDKVLPKLQEAWDYFIDKVWPKVVAAFVYFKDEILPKVVDGMKKFADGVKDAIGKVIQTVTAFVGWLNTNVVPTVQAVVRALVAAWNVYWAVTGPIFKMIALAISVALQVIVAYVRVFVQMFVGLWNGLWQMVSGIVAAVWNGIKGNIQAGLQMIRGIMDIFSGILTGNWSRAWEGVKNVVSGSINGILATLRMFVDIGRSILGGLITWIQSAFSGIANFILVPFRLAVGGFKSLWNSTIGGKGFSLPSWVPGLAGKEFRIPTLHTGGIVPGPVGKEVVSVLQAGEGVLSIKQMRALQSGPAATMPSETPGTVINVTVNAGVGDPAEIGRKIVDSIRSYEKASGAGWRAA
jgi:hypothetical protein